MVRERGSRRLFWLLILTAAVYLVVNLAPPWFGYRMLRFEVEDDARNAHLYTDDQILENIIGAAYIWEVSLAEDNIEIERGDGKIEIAVYYDVDVIFLNRYTKTFHYDIYAVEPLRVNDKTPF
ncbi:MAG: hypothetical protein V3T96_04425 [Thermodesulfobacteriota bacterium]